MPGFTLSRASYQLNLFRHVFSLEPKSPINVWEDFLESKYYRDVLSYYGNACGSKISEKCVKDFKAKRFLSKKCWYDSLTTCVQLWQIIGECLQNDGRIIHEFGRNFVLLEKRCVFLLEGPMWETLCFLLKGIYYLENDIPLKQIQREEPSRFILHSSIAVLPLCNRQEVTHKFLTDIFDRTMELHPEQINERGPVLGQLPIHVAAANKGRFYQETYRFDNNEDFVLPQNFEAYMVERILLANPENASVHDSQGRYPLQLACMNGHSWDFGLQNILEAAPSVIGSSSLLLTLATCTNSAESRPSKTWIRSLRTNSKGLYNQCNRGKNDSLNSVFELIRTDPNAFLNCISS